MTYERCDKKKLVEVIGKGKGHWPSFYMLEAVNDVLPECAEKVDFREINIRDRKDKDRLIELSCALYGKDAVFQQHQLAPIPSLFIDGQLVFDNIPDRAELIKAIEIRLYGEGILHED